MQTQGTETSQYLKEKKSNRDSPSSGERQGNMPKPHECKPAGVVRVGLRVRDGALCRELGELQIKDLVEQIWKDRPQRVIAP